MGKIQLTRGYVARVDEKDASLVRSKKWGATCARSTSGKETVYATHAYRFKGKTKRIYMHRLILGAKKGEVVDHINFNTLDNRRKNLRIVTYAQNRWHSRHLGADLLQRGKRRWRARIMKNGVRIVIGYFETKQQATQAYKLKAKELRGEYA